ncbi:MAG: tRNA (adenosine(37)-N6)-threonylcarbamoyltransferase complex transferase subunit TsaD [Bacteroidetes bacterium]|nr:MAG: tRNA (adenosine(37)-N6)-threonylcarbamoyltransferase complex transferase subunit TsaD [Bacteroidota bacterium]
MAEKDTFILAIESSCDDTSAAVCKNETILSNVVANQEVHKLYGGVVPELASRAHMKHILPVVKTALDKAQTRIEDIDAIAFTKGPGLLGSLLVGVSFAKSIALALNKPLVDVNHMYAHVLAHFIDDESKSKPEFPFICLTVSGGHTQLILVRDYLEMEVIGSTLDDAAGEAFDKIAKLLGFPYPGGPLIDRHAKQGDATRFKFNKPRIEGYNYSFSGLKTSVMNFLNSETQKDPDFIKNNLEDLCASVQHVIIEILFDKLEKAIKDFKIKDIAVAGGVSANSGLRSGLEGLGIQYGINAHIPKFEYCTDNAAMIAITGKFMFEKRMFADQRVSASARLPFRP